MSLTITGLKLDDFIIITESIKMCPYITEFERLKNDGSPRNRVITCREDTRPEEVSEFPVKKQEIAIFIPGICIYLYPDGTWDACPDGDN